jgi:putative ABC transport system permease protein
MYLSPMATPFLEVQSAVRSLRRRPAFALVCILVLAAGIGSACAVFALIDAVMLRPLPFLDPDRLVWIWSTRTDRAKAFFSLPNLADTQSEARTVKVVGFSPWDATLTGRGDPERLQAVRLSGAALPLLGVYAAMGRALTPEDDDPARPRAVMLTDALWHTRFGGDPAVVGSTITLDGQPHVVVGVFPRGFVFPGWEAELVAALRPATDPRRDDRGSNFLRAFGRLAPGATVLQARAELAQITRRLVELYPTPNAKFTAPRVLPLHEELAGDQARPLLLLLVSVGAVLLLACCNLANLLLVRTSARRQELAVRAALGATRKHLRRLLLAEAFVLAVAGGALAIALAVWGTNLLASMAPPELLRARSASFGPRLVLFALACTVLAAGLVGAAPAIQAGRGSTGDDLRGAHALGSPGRSAARQALVAFEVGLSLALLIIAALFARSFARLVAVDPGFNPRGGVAMRLSLPRADYPTPSHLSTFLDALLPRLETLPGVRSAAAISTLPLTRVNNRLDFVVADRPPATAADVPAAQNRFVTPGYFGAMGVTVLRGREFTKWDMAQSPGVVIVDEELERRFFADRPALGAHLRLQYDVPGPREVEIVGVARQVKHDDLNEPPAATVYIPMTQVPQEMLGFVSPRVQLVVRGTGPAMADVVRREVRGLDAQVPISGVRTLQSLVDAAVAPRKFGAGLLSGFALAALLLAASGIYAVAAYSVSQRTREIGVRMALGATARDVVRLVVTESARPVMLGLLGGLIAAAIAARASSALLYSVTALDASSFAAGVAALGASALLASWWPARRATRVDPVIALRS